MNIECINQKDKKIINAELSLFQNGCELNLKFNEIVYKSFDEYPFVALMKLRLQIEELGYYICIIGSLINVFFDRRNAVSTYAIQLDLNKKETTFVKDIFEKTNDYLNLSSVDEQYKFHENWLKSNKMEPWGEDTLNKVLGRN